MKRVCLLERRRKAYIDSVFHYLKRENKKPSYIRIIEDIKYEIDLDRTVLNDALLYLYEKNICKKVAGMTDEEIISAYGRLYKNQGDISRDGKEFLGYITELIARRLHEKAVNNEQ